MNAVPNELLGDVDSSWKVGAIVMPDEEVTGP